jgi:hypothetical protein
MFKTLSSPATNAAKLFRLLKWKGASRIFCISVQKSGTTSTGVFLRKLGYPVSTYMDARNNRWPKSWYDGNIEAIFSSLDFLCAQAFEDAPWWCGDMYKILFHRFPNAKFILMDRDADAWFESLCNHYDREGKGIPPNEQHAKWYQMEAALHQAIRKTESKTTEEILYKLRDHAERYKDFYRSRNSAVQVFFRENGPHRLFYSSLENPLKWDELAGFLGTKNSVGDVHYNRTSSSTPTTEDPASIKRPIIR